MNDTRSVTVHTNWLADIDGMTVANAIAYLQKLNPEHVLDYHLDGGDTHGVEVVSNLSYKVELTNAEQLVLLEQHYARQIAEREKGRQWYIDRGQHDRVPNSDRLIADLKAKLEEARKKYG